MMSFAVIRPNNIVEGVVVWDGETPWHPCHEDDIVILDPSGNVAPGDIYNEDGTFTRETKVVEEVIE